jgi:MraZ protein
VFNGRFDHAIDEKGRVSIPARFRDELQKAGHDRLYITNFIFEREKMLELYPPAEWEAMVAKFARRRTGDRVAQLFETFYIGGAHEVLVDKQGRILVPPKLREFAALKGDVTFSALTDHFQLWDKAVLEEVLKATEQRFQDPEFFQKLGL